MNLATPSVNYVNLLDEEGELRKEESDCKGGQIHVVVENCGSEVERREVKKLPLKDSMFGSVPSEQTLLVAADGQQVPPLYFLKQMSVNGHHFSSLVDINNKPISLPQGMQLLNLPSLPLPASGLSSGGEQPLYVNAKQYHRILKRREARAKLEALGKLPKTRQKYLYESRHRHACKRARACGGKFSNKTSSSSRAAATREKFVGIVDSHSLMICSGHADALPSVSSGQQVDTTLAHMDSTAASIDMMLQ